MKPISWRHGVLGGALLLACGLWAVDHFRGGPRRAQAEQPLATPAAAAPDEAAVADLVARVTDNSYAPLTAELAGLSRDLFVAPPALAAQIAPAQAVEQEPPATAPAVPPPGFAEVHRLTGVVIGAKRYAVVDDRLLAPGVVLDGHRLIEVQRAAVVFEDVETGRTVRLELQAGSARP